MLTCPFPPVGDYAIFVQHWSTPHGGIHGYLSRFLASGDPTFQHIAIWTLLQLLESEDKAMISLIGGSDDICDMIRKIANKQVPDPASRDADADAGDYLGDDGEVEEVINLSERCLELLGQTVPKSHIEG